MKGAVATAFVLVFAAVAATWSHRSLAAEPVKLDFVGTHRDRPLTLHYQGGWRTDGGWAVPEWKPLCTAPCSAWLPAGTYRFAVSVDGKEPVGSDERVSLTRSSVLSGAYVSRQGIRTAGYAMMVGGPALGGFLWLPHIGADEDSMSETARDERRITKYAAIGVAAAGFLGGMIMTVISDRSQVVVEPMGSASAEDVPAQAAVSDLLPVGLSATYRF